MKTIAYLRVSTDRQDLDNQRLSVLDWAQKNDVRIDGFVEISISSRRSTKERGIDDLLSRLQEGDRLVVSELSRLGRSVGQVIAIVDGLLGQGVSFVSVKENLALSRKEQDIQSKVMVTLLGLFAEIERDLVSQRTKAGLAAARAKGKLLGRPKGRRGPSKLDGREEEIRTLLGKGVSKMSLARLLDVSYSTLFAFIRTRGLAHR